MSLCFRCFRGMFPMSIFEWLTQQISRLKEATTDVSLSTRTSPTTESIAPLNPEINPGKREHLCQVDDLNPGGQVPPQGTESRFRANQSPGLLGTVLRGPGQEPSYCRGKHFGCRVMAQGGNFPGFIGAVGGNDDGANLGDMAFYQKLGEGSNMSVDSHNSMQTSMHGGSIHSSVGSNSDSRTGMLGHPGLKGPVIVDTYSVGHSVFRPGRVSHALSDDALAHALMDNKFPTETLKDYEEWTIDLGNLHMGMAFAQGAFGKLYRGTYNGMDVAIKLLERPEADPEQAQLLEQQFVQEVTMLATLRHPNIVKFIGACRKPLVWCIVTEYAKGGSLKNFLSKRQNRSVPLKLAVKQALDVARGMAYVHGLGFVHRDLKSDNLLISGDKSIKVADFGVARIEVKTEGMTPETGTYRWMAPEMIQHRPYSQKVDVYSFAIVLWELVTGNLPFANMTAVQAAFAVVNKGVRPAIPHDCLPALGEIMTRCWDADPEVRPPFTEIVKMLEQVETEVLTTVRKARFRCCVAQPMTLD